MQSRGQDLTKTYTLMQVLNKIGNILSEGWNLYISNMADYNHSRDDSIDDDEILYFITLFLAKKNKSSYKKALLRTIYLIHDQATSPIEKMAFFDNNK
ncbi:unnamed protein product [Rhizophagus irregularis]|nr:unnamed protein product [Rhizophagus irregularis]